MSRRHSDNVLAIASKRSCAARVLTGLVTLLTHRVSISKRLFGAFVQADVLPQIVDAAVGALAVARAFTSAVTLLMAGDAADFVSKESNRTRFKASAVELIVAARLAVVSGWPRASLCYTALCMARRTFIAHQECGQRALLHTASVMYRPQACGTAVLIWTRAYRTERRARQAEAVIRAVGSIRTCVHNAVLVYICTACSAHVIWTLNAARGRAVQAVLVVSIRACRTVLHALS